MKPSLPDHIALDRQEIINHWRKVMKPFNPLPTGLQPRWEPCHGFRAVIFDLYGTLFLSGAGEIGHAAGEHDARCFERVLKPYRRPRPTDAADHALSVWRACIRRAHARANERGIAFPEVDIRAVWRETMAILAREGHVEGAGLDDAAIEKLALDYESIVNPVWPAPGAGQTLRALRKKGVKLGIVSNSQFFTPYLFDALMDASLAQLGFDPDLCVWSYRLGEAKPSARLFKILLEQAAAHDLRQPSEILYAGNDMLNDVWAARQAGLRTVLFAGDRRSLRLRSDDPRCTHIRPDAVITAFEQLNAWPDA